MEGSPPVDMMDESLQFGQEATGSDATYGREGPDAEAEKGCLAERLEPEVSGGEDVMEENVEEVKKSSCHALETSENTPGKFKDEFLRISPCISGDINVCTQETSVSHPSEDCKEIGIRPSSENSLFQEDFSQDDDASCCMNPQQSDGITEHSDATFAASGRDVQDEFTDVEIRSHDGQVDLREDNNYSTTDIGAVFCEGSEQGLSGEWLRPEESRDAEDDPDLRDSRLQEHEHSPRERGDEEASATSLLSSCEGLPPQRTDRNQNRERIIDLEFELSGEAAVLSVGISAFQLFLAAAEAITPRKANETDSVSECCEEGKECRDFATEAAHELSKNGHNNNSSSSADHSSEVNASAVNCNSTKHRPLPTTEKDGVPSTAEDYDLIIFDDDWQGISAPHFINSCHYSLLQNSVMDLMDDCHLWDERSCSLQGEDLSSLSPPEVAPVDIYDTVTTPLKERVLSDFSCNLDPGGAQRSEKTPSPVLAKCIAIVECEEEVLDGIDEEATEYDECVQRFDLGDGFFEARPSLLNATRVATSVHEATRIRDERTCVVVAGHPVSPSLATETAEPNCPEEAARASLHVTDDERSRDAQRIIEEVEEDSEEQFGSNSVEESKKAQDDDCRVPTGLHTTLERDDNMTIDSDSGLATGNDHPSCQEKHAASRNEARDSSDGVNHLPSVGDHQQADTWCKKGTRPVDKASGDLEFERTATGDDCGETLEIAGERLPSRAGEQAVITVSPYIIADASVWPSLASLPSSERWSEMREENISAEQLPRHASLNDRREPSSCDPDRRQRPQKVAALTEATLRSYYEPFDSVRTQLVRQARDVLLCRYQGDYDSFNSCFLTPVAGLLKKIKDRYQERESPEGKHTFEVANQVSCHNCCALKWKGWPLCFNRRLVIHLGDLDSALLKPGDFYFCIREHPVDPATPGGDPVQLLLACRTGEGLRQHVIDESEYRSVFAMDWSPEASQEEGLDDRLTSRLQHLLVSVERGIERIEWESGAKPWTCGHVFPPASPASASRCCHGNQVVDTKDCSVQTGPLEEFRDRMQDSDAATLERADSTGTCGDEEGDIAQMPGRDVSTGGELHEEGKDSTVVAETETAVKEQTMFKEDDQDDGYYDHTLTQPTTISQVDQDLLHSRTALLPGSRDVNGRSVIVISCALLQGSVSTLPSSLAQLLMYFHTIPKKEVISQGFLILVDSSEAKEENWAVLDEAFCLLEANIPNAINAVLVRIYGEYWDESAKLFTASRVKYSVIETEDRLHDFIPRDQLLPDNGGSYTYDHQEWMSFRKFLEPFINGCRLSGRHLVTLLEELRGTRLPPSSSLTHQMIEQQKRHVNQTFHDEQLRHLEEEGETILKELESYRTRSPHNSDYRENLERTAILYDELRRAMKKLSRLADKRLHKLEECLHMRTFEEESSQVLSWLCRKGEETLNKHQSVADTLGGIKEQEQEFEKFYFLAMRQIEKGNDLLEEAAMLGKETPTTVAVVPTKPREDSSNPGGVQCLESSLRQHLGSFNERLEDTREKLEDTAKCYSFLDKTYEWALQAMRFVSQMGLDSTGTPEGILKLIKTLQDYLDEHPPISEETFLEMIELATKLGKERLIDQCKTAQVRCQETIELIQTRKMTLQKVKQQLELGSLRNQWDAEDIQTPRKARSLSQPNNVWVPQGSSTPFQPIPGTGVHQRRKSVSTTTPQIYGSPPLSSYTAFLSNYYPSSGIRETCQIDNYLQEKEDHLLSHGLITEDLTSQGPVTSISWTPLEGRTGQSNRDGQNATVTSKCVSNALKGNKAGPGTSSSVQSNSQHKQIKKYVRRCLSWQSCEEALEKASADVREQNERLKVERLHSPPDESNESLNSISESDDIESCSKLPVTHTRSDPTRGPVPVNTHLNRVSTLELADAVINEQSLNDEEAKAKKTLMLIMKEMIQTERDYVKSLEYIIENYIPELMREDIPQALRGQRNVIFGNIEKIYEFHSQYFLNELEQCENIPFTVGQCFLHYEPQFYLYALYNKNKPKSDSLMSEYGNSFFRKKQLELEDKMDLASYLLKPVQRMGKYALLLKQLVKECPEREAEHQDLKAAEEMVRFQLRHGNDLLAMDALRDCDVNVKEQGRLLRQDEFLVWQGRSRKSLRHVFLFEDLILFSKARRDPDRKGYEIFQYKHSFKTTDIGLTEQIGDSPTKFEIWFRKRKLNDVYVVQAPSPDIKMSWVQEISKLLWKQALRNREMRLAEMSSMGIGNKPCLDIKPSEDQISDRSISIHQLTRASRFRSSANSLQFDHLRNNKRPHSIISVSSSSSSGSSQSSFTFYGALNLGFEPGDSPRPLHRSLTQQSQCSTESGFCTDVSVAGDSPVDSEHPHKKAERSDSLLSSDSLSTSATTSDLTSSPGEEQTLEESITTSM